jgi:molybdopterin/thiamine biosynthesis adenylyltransferase
MFRRQIELIEKNQKNLENKSILIIGAGGLGNVVATELSCIGLKNIYIMDFDEIEIHNIHRQFQFSKQNIGEKKAKILAQKIDRCETKIEYFCEKFESFDKELDLIIDCTDNFEVRKKIDNFAKNRNIPWLYSSVEGWIGQVCLFKEKNLDIFNINNSHKVSGVMPAMVGLVGSIEAMIATKYLAGLEVEFDKLIYIDFTKSLRVSEFGL